MDQKKDQKKLFFPYANVLTEQMSEPQTAWFVYFQMHLTKSVPHLKTICCPSIHGSAFQFTMQNQIDF